MAKAKFRSTVAKCGDMKSNTALIDSGGSHHFFHSKRSFQNYERMEKTNVQAPRELSIIVEKCLVTLLIDGGFYVEAFHAPKLTTNILSVGQLSNSYNVLFTKDPPTRNCVSSCIMWRRNSTDVVLNNEIDEDGLYRMQIEKHCERSIDFAKYGHEVPCTCCGAKHNDVSQKALALDWHYKTGNSAPISEEIHEIVINFSRCRAVPSKIAGSIFCVPCATAKAQRAPVSRSLRMKINSLELVHMEISGKMHVPSLGSSNYAVGFVGDATAKSDVYFIKTKDELYPSLTY